MESVCEKIRRARESVSLSYAELGAKVGISSEACRDLELFPDEVTNVLELTQFLKLCDVLHLDVENLLSVAPSSGFESLSPVDVLSLLTSYVGDHKVELTQLEDELGWELAGCLEDVQSMRKRPLMFFMDLGKVLSIDWFRLAKAYV